VVCLSVGLSVCRDHEPYKKAEPIEMPFWDRCIWTRVSPRKHVLDGSPGPYAKGDFRAKGQPIVKYNKSCTTRAQQLR